VYERPRTPWAEAEEEEGLDDRDTNCGNATTFEDLTVTSDIEWRSGIVTGVELSEILDFGFCAA
jgi:hypothetical protein